MEVNRISHVDRLTLASEHDMSNSVRGSAYSMSGGMPHANGMIMPEHCFAVEDARKLFCDGIIAIGGKSVEHDCYGQFNAHLLDEGDLNRKSIPIMFQLIKHYHSVERL